MYEEFKHPNPLNKGLYVFIEGPVELLGMEIPADANNSKTDIVYDEDGNIVSFRQKTVAEYLALSPYMSLDGTRCIILLNEKYDPRIDGVNEGNITKWDLHLTPLGLGYETGLWMGLDGSDCANKVSDRLGSVDYIGGSL